MVGQKAAREGEEASERRLPSAARSAVAVQLRGSGRCHAGTLLLCGHPMLLYCHPVLLWRHPILLCGHSVLLCCHPLCWPHLLQVLSGGERLGTGDAAPPDHHHRRHRPNGVLPLWLGCIRAGRVVQ